LAFERLADRFERRKPDRPGLAVFQHGNIGHRDADSVGKLGDTHLPLRQHDVDVNDDGHSSLVTLLSRFRILYRRHFVRFFQTRPPQWRSR